MRNARMPLFRGKGSTLRFFWGVETENLDYTFLFSTVFFFLPISGFWGKIPVYLHHTHTAMRKEDPSDYRLLGKTMIKWAKRTLLCFFFSQKTLVFRVVVLLGRESIWGCNLKRHPKIKANLQKGESCVVCGVIMGFSRFSVSTPS